MNTCCNCGKPAQVMIGRIGFPEDPFCWDCASSPNVLAEPVRPPDVDPEEFDDFIAYRLAVLDGQAPYFGPDDVCLVLVAPADA